jgi:Dna[CI] antecedent, DciA
MPWSGPSPRARSKPVDKLGNILPRVLRRQPGGARLLGVQVAAAFRMVIGPEPAALCDEIDIHSGTLVVTTSSPALAHQLRLDSQLIVDRLNGLDLGRKVRALRVRIGHSTRAQ